MDEITHVIIEIINGLLGDNSISEFQKDDNLADIGLDSIQFIQLVVSLEEKFGCEIPDSKLILSEMDTVNKIVSVLSELKIVQSLV